ncbi:translation initiation factor IF-2 [Patescibacteria group bacterium]|nr:translation initiation factor IF-2 [Patescibacteria group bacterium]
MNVTELARRIHVSPNEMRDLLPRLGFDIGRKAIKVDEKAAQTIIERVQSSPDIIEKYRQEKLSSDETEDEITETHDEKITIPSVITVRDFATLINKPVVVVIQELMKNGILANLNEQIDYETANIIAQDFGYTTTTQTIEKDLRNIDDNSIEKLLSEDSENLTPRPPIVVVMGHVDHGKTQLLDTIRKTKVVEQESGGITQHIGAYQIIKNKNPITLIDTPGHEAFTTMRSRGARVADLAILVIAADDGIKPQTEEAIQIIESAKLPFIVAINKMDKTEADQEKIKQQLAQKNLLPEDWGGKIMTIPVSAKTGDGIDRLLESLLLLADVEKENIQANTERSAIGTVIESHIDKGEGPVATVIVQTGTLHQGDTVQVGHVVGKIKAMKDFQGTDIILATPSMPVKILGLKESPEVGDVLRVTNANQSLKKIKKQLQQKRTSYRNKQTWQQTQTKGGGGEDDDEKNKSKKVNVILKTDTVGSQEAIAQSLEQITAQDIKVVIVKKGLGNITDDDVLQSESSGSLIFGFNVKINQRAEELAKEKELPVRIYSVIYDLIDEVQKETDKLVTYETEAIELGRIKVLEVFRTEKNSMIIGGMVTKGKIIKDSMAKIIRDDEEIGTITITQLQKAQQEVNEVAAGTECGIQLKGTDNILQNDFIVVYKEEIKK